MRAGKHGKTIVYVLMHDRADVVKMKIQSIAVRARSEG
jgi:hypothetical protein